MLPPENPSPNTGFTSPKRIDELLGINQPRNDDGSIAKVEELDLHGYTYDDAVIEIDSFLSFVGKDVDEVHIIHGYHSGNAIKNYIKHELRHKRLKKKVYSLNQGVTILQLKK